MAKKFLSYFASFLVVLAGLTAMPASWFILNHHPKAPKCILK